MFALESKYKKHHLFSSAYGIGLAA